MGYGYKGIGTQEGRNQDGIGYRLRSRLRFRFRYRFTGYGITGQGTRKKDTKASL